MTGPHLSEQAVDRLADVLGRQRGKRIRWSSIWACFAEAFPHRPKGHLERQLLHAALERLRERGLIEFPAERSHLWDGSAQPLLPQMVTRIEQRAAVDESWRALPWHPRLAWVPDLPRLSTDQVAFLRRVHEGLVERWFDRPAPLRYRSIQLTGDDKRLEALLGTVLFGEGRLNLEMIGAYTVVLPLAWERVQEGGRVIAFENKEPFIVARTVLHEMRDPPYDIVAFGGGRGFEQSVAHLTTIDCPITVLEYVGDLDEPGLEIASRAADAALRADRLPPLLPAPGVHAVMLDAAAALGHPSGWPDSENRRTMREEALTWLPDSVRGRVQQMLSARRRVPEEVLGPAEMRRMLLSS
jgi:hypothetical protein